jgi:polyhydroxybutyrate depolymerase
LPLTRLRIALIGYGAWFLVFAAIAMAVADGGRSAGDARSRGPSSGCAGPAAGAGERSLKIVTDGDTRTALLHVPQRRDGAPMPLVVALHGGGATGRFMAGYSGLSKAADSAGFAVVYPDAAPPARYWDRAEGAEQDVGFIKALLDRVESTECIDEGRVSAVGVSNGGGFAARLACDLSDRLAAVAIVAGTFRGLPACRAAHPVSVLEIHGTADRSVPYEGGEDGGGAILPWLEGWVRRDGCAGSPSGREVAERVMLLDWRGCAGGTRVEHLRIAGGEHQWPGATPVDPGPPSTISAATWIARFLTAGVID